MFPVKFCTLARWNDTPPIPTDVIRRIEGLLALASTSSLSHSTDNENPNYNSITCTLLNFYTMRGNFSLPNFHACGVLSMGLVAKWDPRGAL